MTNRIPMIDIRFSELKSPLGKILIAASDRGVCQIAFGLGREAEFVFELQRRFGRPRLVRDDQGLRRWTEQLRLYWTGRHRRFRMPLDLRGLTDFQTAVLEATCKIPYGQTRSYKDVARAVGAPRASRAVGNALGRNPVPIVIPCHRVVASGGIGGFTGGLHVKLRLMEREGIGFSKSKDKG